MDKLKKKIIQYYIITIILAYLALTFVDSVFEEVLFPTYIQSVPGMTIALILNLIISILIITIAVLVFSAFATKRFEDEKRRSLEYFNSLYTDLAHDLKTPITSILGFLKAIIDEKIEAKDRVEIETLIYHKTMQVNKLIDSMYEFSKLSNTVFSLNKEPSNLNTLVRNIAAKMYVDFESRGFLFEVDIPETDKLIMIDPFVMERGVTNLLENAIKHNRSGTRVLLKISNSEDTSRIDICDDGEIIPMEVRDTIFDPFVRPDESRSTEAGSGLGLAITKKIVEKHGGTVSLMENVEGFQKCFRIELSDT